MILVMSIDGFALHQDLEFRALASFFFWGGGHFCCSFNREFVVAGIVIASSTSEVKFDTCFSLFGLGVFHERNEEIAEWRIQINRNRNSSLDFQPPQLSHQQQTLGNVFIFSLQRGHPEKVFVELILGFFMAGTSRFDWLIQDQSKGHLGHSKSVPQKPG